ncbi:MULTISPECIES: hypothetical protein [unclassified Mesorhizobium]|uniref:hypothetical protein n=1 Tax=unclassified Mesorhizobium TaxID=325217 RepID=UPI000F74D5FD|nr:MULTISPECIES: hypothetical protein [unclassified Mesorhizobium]AZO21839.1 hypothetical protein EJ070_14880 [Mesorhizobium sp. M1E.F.Ca.ET.045.02.1.1]RUW37162.1 hypothetical protein EOA38_04485 [Mesorhizobium sp. M1E.F.Ca.ET.041.01.1.1]RUW83945.1 hypothetical protein EOA29_11310 [Mesorhizobium sp. M1E.F.Ca.ET.063.01.1.1]RWB61428.1 MAG: hypothetical protein EOQ47_00895 [Mesorhizobium sp.]RWD90351.1 MAG: hypothetical protein EOS38_08735 [Mesorhizobium sp.]
MDRFIALANIAHFEDLLARETDPEKRMMIRGLLAREKEKLKIAERQAETNQKRAAPSRADDQSV